jgi:hypothetical protein
VNFSFFKFSLRKKKKSKTPQTFLLMLEANKNNLEAIPKSSSIKLTRANGFVIFSLNFKHIEITIGDKESTTILKMCRMRKKIILPLILTVLYLL